jgi:hypothetical protein
MPTRAWLPVLIAVLGGCSKSADDTPPEPVLPTIAAAAETAPTAEEWVNVSAEAKEVTDVEYGGNLEFFVEKTIADKFVVRLAAQNLLDSDKDEQIGVFESVEQLQAGTPVTSVHQIEESDPVYILTFRGTF